jgi:hypothetical protein
VMDTNTLTHFEAPLIKEYGAIVSGEKLWKVLGYRSGHAFRKAVGRKTVPVPLFKETGRRGWFARTHDIAVWLISLDEKLITKGKEGIKK